MGTGPEPRKVDTLGAGLGAFRVLLQTRVFDENGGSGTSVVLHTNK